MTSTLDLLPLTGVSQTLDWACLLLAWAVVGWRIRRAQGQVVPTVRHMYRYFGYFMLFNLFMAVPHTVIFTAPGFFSPFMAWGYVLGNVFLLISLSHLSRLVVKVVPQLGRFDHWVQVAWIGLNVVVTGLNLWEIGFLHQPTYDAVTRVTHYAIPGWMGAMLGMISAVAYLPAIVVFGLGVIRQHGAKRVRSVLLVLGLAMIMVVGPLHAVAATWQVFLTADLLNVVSLLLLAGGTLYRFEQTAVAPVANTV